MNDPSAVYPYTIRLSVDVDPSGHPIGMSAVQYVRGAEEATLWVAFPGPFDSLAEAFGELAGDYRHYLGRQLTLF